MLLLVNWLFIPQYGYMACAWAGVAAYGSAMLLSYFVGQHYYPVKFPLRDMAIYAVLAAVLSAAALMVKIDNEWLGTAYRTVLLLLFCGVVFKREHMERLLVKVPVVGRYFQR